MALSYYEGTNEGSASGWQRRFHSSFKSATGQVYRVEIIDSGGHASRALAGFGGSGSQHFLLGADGVTINWDGGADDTHAPFMGSTLSLDFLVEGVYHRQLWSQIQQMQDDRFGVALWRHQPDGNSSTSTTTPDSDPDGAWRLEWTGLLLAENVQFVDHESHEMLRLEFSDGLARLNEVDFLDSSGDPFTGSMTLAQLVDICLGKIATSSLFGYAFGTGTGSLTTSTAVPFFTERIYCLTDKHDDVAPGAFSVFQNVRVSASAFYSIKKEKDELGGSFVTRESTSCAEVLRNVLRVLRMRISMSSGRWEIVNPSSLLVDSYVHTFAHVGHHATRSVATIGTAATAASIRDSFGTGDSAEYVPAKGFSSGLLFPIKTALSVHKDGGSYRVLSGVPQDLNHVGIHNQTSPSGSVYTVKHATASPVVLSNPDVLITGGDPILIRGRCGHTEVGWNYGYSTSFADEFRNCKIILSFKIKCGVYYLKRDLVSAASSDAVNTNRPAAADFDYLDWNQTGNVEWTTNSSDTYDLVVPFTGCEPEPPVVIQGTNNDILRVGGMHVKLHSNEEQYQYQGPNTILNTTLQPDLKFDFEWVPPAPPLNITHEGLEVTISAKYYDAGNNEITGSTLTDAVNVNAVQYWTDFGVFTNPSADEGDVNFAAEITDNNAALIVSESILGDKYAGSSANAATLKHQDPQTPGFSYTGESWRTVDQAGTNNIHKLNALEAVQERAKTTRVLEGTVLFNNQAHALPAYNLLSYVTPLRPSRSIRYSVTEASSAVDFDAIPMALTWTVRSNTFDGRFAVFAVDRTISPTQANNSDRARGGIGGGVVSDTPNENTPTEALLAVKSQALSGGSGSLSAADVAKLAAITMSGNNISNFTTTGTVLTSDAIEDASSAHKFATAGQLTAIASNSALLGTISAVLKDTVTGDGIGVYIDKTDDTKSHLSVTGSAAKLQVGSNTGAVMTESSPGVITLQVQGGQVGAEAAQNGIVITGQTLVNMPTIEMKGQVEFEQDVEFEGATKTVTFTAGTSGIEYADLSGKPTIPSNVTDMGDVTNAGSGIIITDAERTKLNGIATGAEVNVVTANLQTADVTLSENRTINMASNFLTFKDGTNTKLQYDPNDDRFEFVGGLQVSGDLVTTTGGMTSGLIKFQEPAMGGTNGVVLKGPSTNLTSDLTFVLPSADGSAGQFLKTDGAGNLSFAAAGGGGGGMTETPLQQISGRYTWSSADDGERVHTGNSSYGPANWYSFSSEPTNATLRNYDASHAVDSTTSTVSAFHLQAYGHALPSDSKKVRVRTFCRYQNANGKTFGWSLWHAATFPSDGSTSNVTVTLVGKSSDTVIGSSSTALYRHEFTTTSALSGGMVFLMAENRAGSLTSTTYAYCNASLFLVD